MRRNSLIITDETIAKYVSYFLLTYMFYKVVVDNVTLGIFKAVMMLLIVITFGLFFLRNKQLHKSSGLLISFLLYAVFIVLYAVVDGNMTFVSRGLYEYLMYQMIIFSSAYLFFTIDFEKIYTTIVVVALPMGLSSIIMYFMGQFDSEFRAIGFGRSEMSQAMLCGVLFLMSVQLFGIRKRRLYLVFALIYFISLLTTGSRGPLVGTVVAYILIYVIESVQTKRLAGGLKIAFFGVLFLIAAIWFFSADITTGNAAIDGSIARIQATIDWRHDAGNVGRIKKWEYWLNRANESLWFGVGMSRTGSWGGAIYGVTESGLIRHIIELGVVGSILYYALILCGTVPPLKRIKRRRGFLNKMILLHVGIIIAISIEDLVLQITEEITVAFFLWWSVGAIVGLYLRECRHTKSLSDVVER